MPEELENTQTPEVVETESESPAVEAVEEPRVPVRVVQELREEKRRLEQQMQMQQMQMMQMMQNHQPHPQPPQETLDPEVEKLIAPYLKRATEPLIQQLQQYQTASQQFEMTQKQLEAERYLERNLPNLAEIRADIVREIETLPESERNAIISNPVAIAQMGKLITKMKGGTTTAKEQMRSRARVESGGGAPTTPTVTSDLEKLNAATDDVFREAIRKMGFLD